MMTEFKRFLFPPFFPLILFVLSLFLFTSPSFSQTPISIGETITGSISTTGERDEYTFTASANDRVIVRMSRTSGDYFNPEIRLDGSDGSKLCDAHTAGDGYYGGSTAEISDCPLPSDGTYTIIASEYGGHATGNYNLTLDRLNVGGGSPISFGQTVSGTLAMGDMDNYTFTAVAK